MPNFYGFTLILLVASCHGGLVQRRYRDVGQQSNQIPVQVIELADGATFPLPSEQKKLTPEPVSNEISAPHSEVLQPAAAVVETTQIAEDIAKAFDEKQKLSAVDALVEAERKKDEQIVQQEIVEAVKEENQQLLRAVAALEQAEEPKEAIKEPVPLVEKEKFAEPAANVEEKLQQVEEKAPIQQLKAVPLNVEEPNVAVVENVKQPVAVAEVAAENPEVVAPNVRQAVTQPTPTQTSTQQNFLQQLIQPVGQFISQFTGGQQQQQQTAAATDGAAPAAPAAPLPTLPGFLNPAVAITSAQQAVQNAAQTLVNSTSQAFQGLQQFASNLGSGVQNTLSGLGGQQTLSTADVTTTRPPGPFQAIISNFIGGGGQQQQAASEPLPGTGGGPLQGIISFFQGGNRPTVAAATSSTTAEPVKINLPTSAAGVDDKIDEAAAPEETVVKDEDAAASAAASNEVRNSAEVAEDAAEDSLEESQPEELIVVNDDAATESDTDPQSTK